MKIIVGVTERVDGTEGRDQLRKDNLLVRRWEFVGSTLSEPKNSRRVKSASAVHHDVRVITSALGKMTSGASWQVRLGRRDQFVVAASC